MPSFSCFLKRFAFGLLCLILGGWANSAGLSFGGWVVALGAAVCVIAVVQVSIPRSAG